jgi:hypothetical protein
MNKRIKELADEAYALCGKHSNDYNGPAFTEKFAELIVQECIEQLVKEGDAWEQFSRNPPEGQKTNASAALFAAHRLKEDAVSRLEEHFGVEE